MNSDGKQTWIWLIIANICCWAHQSSGGRTRTDAGEWALAPPAGQYSPLHNVLSHGSYLVLVKSVKLIVYRFCNMDFLVFQLFRVEILFNGRKHFVLRRYSDFQTLHRKLKKIVRAPDFPSKRNQHLRTKPLEQRQQELEDYIQVETRSYMLL